MPKILWRILIACFAIYMLIALYGHLHPRNAVQIECEEMGITSYDNMKECVKLIEWRDELRQQLNELRELKELMKPKGIKI